MKTRTFVAIAALGVAIGCSKQQPEPVAKHYGQAVAWPKSEQVCQHLASTYCKSIAPGQPDTCGPICATIAVAEKTCEYEFGRDQGKVTDFKPECLLAATTTAEAEACGTVRCTDPPAPSPEERARMGAIRHPPRAGLQGVAEPGQHEPQ